MPKVTLQRSTSIVFCWPRPDGSGGEIEIPALTVGRYRAALALEAEEPETASNEVMQARLLKQAQAMLPETLHWFLEELDPEMVIEVMQALLSIYSGLDPAGVLEVQRALKKKAITALLTEPQAPPNDSESATT